MPLSYHSYVNGQTNIKHNNEDLVLGFCETFSNEGTEMLYAVHKDGRVKSAYVALPNDHFNDGFEWFDVTGEVPPLAEFIGNYPADMF